MNQEITAFINQFYHDIDVTITNCYTLLTYQNYDYDQFKSKEMALILDVNCYKALNDTTNKTKSDFIIMFIAKIFLDICTKHKLYNGNKRFATCFLFYCLSKYQKELKINVNKLLKDVEHTTNMIVMFTTNYSKTHDEANVLSDIIT